MEINGGSSSNTQYGVEKLVGTNYRYWRMCMDAFLQGQDLWELVSGVNEIPADTPKNVESRKKWKIKCGKALFALRTSINKEFIDHVCDVSTNYMLVHRHYRSSNMINELTLMVAVSAVMVVTVVLMVVEIQPLVGAVWCCAGWWGGRRMRRKERGNKRRERSWSVNQIS
uniref:DUF4219 domain-containing protein n=1 Tax=Nelumbo nucifera TaxID=4432 RepID=A0A822YM13_NELNU|nr:TPA_asm: hypothetical protein HUJ06_011472 [Nelumbo nucifera]